MTSWMQLQKLPPLVYGQDEYPWPNRFSIETSAFCNRSCGFCPISLGGRPTQKLMSWDLYNRVVEQLAEREFDGVVQLFLLNEPLLNKRFKDEARHLRAHVPHCGVYVSTNADVINRGHMEEKLERMVDVFDSGVTCINLNIYDAGEQQFRDLWAIADLGEAKGLWEMTEHKYRRHAPGKRVVCVTDMRPERLTASSTDMFYDRIKNPGVVGLERHCARPHRHVVVLHDGRVPLCCALDPTASDLIVAGDLNHQTIDEVWNSELMWKYRAHLQDKRRDLPGCSTCNHKMSYPHVVRRVAYADGPV